MLSLVDHIECMLGAVESISPNAKGICSHFGVGERWRKYWIDLCVGKEKMHASLHEHKQIFIVIKTHRDGQAKYIWDKHKREIVNEYGFLDTWGGGGHLGSFISIVTDTIAPSTLYNAIKEYHQATDVFKFTEQEHADWDEFHRQFHENFEFLRDQFLEDNK